MVEVGGSTADPAKLVAAQRAQHMVAAGATLDLDPAHGAESDVERLLGGPLAKLLLHVLFAAAHVPMPWLSAQEADPVFTDWALHTAACLARCAPGDPLAVLFWAESHQRIPLLHMLVRQVLQALKSLLI